MKLISWLKAVMFGVAIGATVSSKDRLTKLYNDATPQERERLNKAIMDLCNGIVARSARDITNKLP
jgi:hypothetical protein